MSGIVLSASVRQNLLSLQSTADLLATTQGRLATGKKVNSALDNPTNFFTAQGLDNRASDIGNLLDSIGNGVQVLQAANTGITSLQKLVDSAKSIANQALQTTIGYSTKSNVSTTIAGATASDLRGTTTFASTTATGNVLYSGAASGVTAAISTSTLGGTQGVFTTGTVATLASLADGDSFTVNGKTITVKTGAPPATVTGSSALVGNSVVTDGSGNSTVYLGSTPAATAADFATAIDLASGVQAIGAITVVSGSNTATAAKAPGQT